MIPPQIPADGDLAIQALAGEHQAFTQLMRRHKEPLYRFIRHYVGDSEEAYDLLQEAFASAWRSLARYDHSRPFAAWLRTIALNKCRDWSRRRKLRRWLISSEALDSPGGQALADGGPGPEVQLAEKEQLEHLAKAISALPNSLKEPLLLTAIDQLSQEEAGRILGISRKAVELRVHRARTALGRAVGQSPTG